MIDTTAINFGIQKLTQAFNAAAPQIQNVSAEYVKFVVAKAVILVPVLFVLSIFSSVVFYFAFKWGMVKDGYGDTKFSDCEPGPCLSAICSGITTVVLIIVLMCSVYDAALAIWCPEMYTVNQIIGAAK
jgi:hypothetical protein